MILSSQTNLRLQWTIKVIPSNYSLDAWICLMTSLQSCLPITSRSFLLAFGVTSKLLRSLTPNSPHSDSSYTFTSLLLQPHSRSHLFLNVAYCFITSLLCKCCFPQLPKGFQGFRVPFSKFFLHVSCCTVCSCLHVCLPNYWEFLIYF